MLGWDDAGSAAPIFGKAGCDPWLLSLRARCFAIHILRLRFPPNSIGGFPLQEIFFLEPPILMNTPLGWMFQWFLLICDVLKRPLGVSWSDLTDLRLCEHEVCRVEKKNHRLDKLAHIDKTYILWRWMSSNHWGNYQSFCVWFWKLKSRETSITGVPICLDAAGFCSSQSMMPSDWIPKNIQVDDWQLRHHGWEACLWCHDRPGLVFCVARVAKMSKMWQT